jgi:hypothetical protein
MGNDNIGHPAAKLLRNLYTFPNGVMVVGNVWICKSAMGLPFDVIFECLKNERAMPHWAQLIEQGLKEGMGRDKLISEIRLAVIDVWGMSYWIGLSKCLKDYYSSREPVPTTAK